jgi:hypothetical protein
MLLYITLSNMLFSVKPPDENGMRIETTHALAATGATLFLTARNTAEPQSVLDTNITLCLHPSITALLQHLQYLPYIAHTNRDRLYQQMTSRIQQPRPKIPISPNNCAAQSPNPIVDLDKERRIYLEFAIVQVTFLEMIAVVTLDLSLSETILFIPQIQEQT